MSINSKIAVLTGANGQLGRVFLKSLLADFFKVYAVDLLFNNLTPHENVTIKNVDITKEKEVVAFFKSISRVDVLVNNAGVGVFTPFEERTFEELDKVIRVNLLGTTLMCREAVKKMLPLKNGTILNIGSVYGQVSSDPRIYGESHRLNSDVYSATKAGVIMLSKYLAAHYAPNNIRVNTLSPGGVFNHQSEDFIKEYEKKVPAGRMASPEDLLPTFRLLTSCDNPYLTGQNITVDGGFSAW